MALPRTGCIGCSCVTRKSNCCKEITPILRLRTGCIDYPCVTRKSNFCTEILPKPVLRTGCIDYSCVTRKPNCCKEIRPKPLPRTGCIDYSCVTRKSNCCKEMSVSGGVPIIPVSHVSLSRQRYSAEMMFSRPAQVSALRRQEVVVADGRHSPSIPGFRHLSLAVNLVSFRDSTPLESATALAFASRQ